MEDKLKELLAQEEKLQFSSFSNKDALDLGLIVIDIVKKNYHGGVAIHIERNQTVLFTHLMEGASYENYSWFHRKKKVVERYDHSSMYVGEKFLAQGATVNDASFLSPSEYQAVGGSFPILLKGSGAVGTLSISGLTSEEDHEVCVLALTKLKKLKADREGCFHAKQA